MIVRGWGERGAQLRYENHGYETSMRFNTIIDGNHKGVTVTLEDNGKTGFLDYHGDKSKQIRTWPCEM